MKVIQFPDYFVLLPNMFYFLICLPISQPFWQPNEPLLCHNPFFQSYA